MSRLIFTILFSCGVLYSNWSFAQNSAAPEFYRTYALKPGSEGEKGFDSATFSQDLAPFEFVAYCERSGEVLVRISASYPKRTPEIEAELRLHLKNWNRNWQTAEIRMLSIELIKSFCQ